MDEKAKEFRDKKIIRALLREIEKKTKNLPAPLRIMEVCGTHTMTMHKYGLKKLLEESGIIMLSGPGCPVCITPNEYHDAAINLVTTRENLILATFGDMTRVPAKTGSLQTVVPASGSRVKIIYSAEEALKIARENSRKEVVFFGVGFETTIPSIAFAVKIAGEKELPNFSLLAALWLIPPPLQAIVEARETQIQGFLYPGHVSAIIGKKPYEFIAEKYGIPGAISGFEPSDILLGIRSILNQIHEGKAKVDITYSRAVRAEGNPVACAVMEEVLEVKDAIWRGLGLIPKSGLRLKEKYSAFDVERKYGISIESQKNDLPGCCCGEVLRGIKEPPQCPLFAEKCRPDSPFGPCMVSFEGACLVYFKYGKC